jgi:hypothetical protein
MTGFRTRFPTVTPRGRSCCPRTRSFQRCFGPSVNTSPVTASRSPNQARRRPSCRILPAQPALPATLASASRHRWRPFSGASGVATAARPAPPSNPAPARSQCRVPPEIGLHPGKRSTGRRPLVPTSRHTPPPAPTHCHPGPGLIYRDAASHLGLVVEQLVGAAACATPVTCADWAQPPRSTRGLFLGGHLSSFPRKHSGPSRCVTAPRAAACPQPARIRTYHGFRTGPPNRDKARTVPRVTNDKSKRSWRLTHWRPPARHPG